MDHRFSYLDANSPYVGAGQTLSASSSYLPYNYEQKPMDNGLSNLYACYLECTRRRDSGFHASASPNHRPVTNMIYPTNVAGSYGGCNTSNIPYGQVSATYTAEEAWQLYISDMQRIDPNYRPSASPFNMSMSSTIISTDQYETLHEQKDVSRFYPSASDSWDGGSPSDWPMDGRVGQSSGYPQPSYAAPHTTTCSVPCATNKNHYSARLHGHSRIGENSAEACMPAYGGKA